MALIRLGATDIISAVQTKIKEKTGLKCYDHVELNTPSPLYYAELVQTVPANNKTMFRDRYIVWVHCIAEKAENGSSEGIYELVRNLEEAMTEDITLPEGFVLIQQTYNGMQGIHEDETGEKHAVCAFEFMVCYGFRCKI